jgi:hypothetical protein
MTLDFLALGLSIAVLIFASRATLPFTVGKHTSIPADRKFTFVILFPLGAALSIVSTARLLGHFALQFSPLSKIGYAIGFDLYIGWVLTVLGLLGIRSFKSLQGHLRQGFVIVAIACGPLLLGLGIFQVAVTLRS